MTHVRNVEYILKNYETIFIFAENDIQNNQYLQFFQTIFVYLYKNIEIGGSQLETIVTSINQPLKKFTMSAYDLLIEKGEKIGIEKGVTLENTRKIRKVVMNLLSEFPSWSNEKIASLADTTIDFVEQIRTELN
jgi:hypothetical protein